MLADVVHESLEITEYRCDSHPFRVSSSFLSLSLSLSLSLLLHTPPLGSLPPVSASNATPRSALFNRPPFPPRTHSSAFNPPDNRYNYKTDYKGVVSHPPFPPYKCIGHRAVASTILRFALKRVVAHEDRRFQARRILTRKKRRGLSVKCDKNVERSVTVVGGCLLGEGSRLEG